MMLTVTSGTPATAQLVGRLAARISRQPVEGNVSLLTGQTGFALVEAYSRILDPAFGSDRTLDRLLAGLSAIQQGELTHHFASGMAGVAWGFLHLSRRGLIDVEPAEAQAIVADLDEPLFELSLDDLRHGNFDYLYGGLGAGLYFLERKPTPTISRYMELLVEELAALAVRYPNGDITWPFLDLGRRSLSDPPLYNLGLAHGTAGVVVLLALFRKYGFAGVRCAELMQGGLQWLWNQRNTAGRSRFPNRVGENRENQESRLGWCYGDLGVAHAFWMGSRALNHADWKAVALQTTLHAARRRDLSTGPVHDAGLCHGSAGLAHLFRWAARRMAHPYLAETADYWLEQTLRFARAETDDDVFRAFNHETGHYESHPGLLQGEAGVALALLGALDQPIGWDRLMLLS
ncbi:lanthionine synthetase C family protein [Larkinella soli]|uniref:lanthionine synthetase C family protein n=1 Tax=Larkinella soli TaxID=1770527 RepID=UPI000FFBDA5F|nr:lanthionine synthetase C family protein [Larkinella soli]